jgi:hypothetical protein
VFCADSFADFFQAVYNPARIILNPQDEEAGGVQSRRGAEMKKFIFIVLAMALLTSCNGWFFQPSPYQAPTPFLPATNTPPIVSATPIVNTVNSATPAVATSIPVMTSTPFAVFTDTALPIVTNTTAFTETASVPMPAVSVQVLGCNTSIDVTHGMGEVTNAFVTLKNTGNVDLTNLKATLNARDEGRVHPDKTAELTVLPVAYSVTVKLTVDSTYREETPIQIEVTGDGGLFQRVGESSCSDIGLLMPKPESLMTPIPSNP